MNIRPRSFDPASVNPATEGSEQGRDQRLDKQKTFQRTGITFPVDRVLLDGLKRSQQKLRDWVDGYVQSSLLLGQWIEIRSLTDESKRPAHTGDDDWFDYWTDLAVRLESAQDPTDRLADTNVLRDDVERFAHLLDAARERLPKADGNVDAEVLGEMLADLDDVLDDMGVRIRSLNDAFARSAQAEVKKLNRVVSDIFEKTKANITREERQVRGEAAPSPRDDALLATRAVNEARGQPSARPDPTQPKSKRVEDKSKERADKSKEKADKFFGKAS